MGNVGKEGRSGRERAGKLFGGRAVCRDGGKAAGQEKWLWRAAFAALLCLQIMTIIYFGGRKTGFHEDEYYSFYSTNRTAGLYEPDREWVDRDAFRDEFVVLHGEGFRYGLVATVQSWDVHPPLFYFLLHTACSLFPGVFSKWLGIGVNLIAFCLNFGLLSWLAYMVTGKNKWLAWVTAAVHGFNPVIISGVMFIRMYEWLTVFVLLCACLHVHAVKRWHEGTACDMPAEGEGQADKGLHEEKAVRKVGFKSFLLPLMAVNYLGFLTQYYYIIFLFFMAAGFCLWILLPCAGKKEDGGSRPFAQGLLQAGIRECLKYGGACGVSLLMAVMSYPASLSHIFRGYRGTGAVSEFLDGENTRERLRFFAGLMDEYLFDGYLWLWFALMACMGAAAFIICRKDRAERGTAVSGPALDVGQGRQQESQRGREGGGTVFFMLLFAVGGYFFAVSKTALLLYETSNRYQLPIYGMVILLVMVVLAGLWKRIGFFCCKGNAAGMGRWMAAGSMALLFLFLVGDVHEINDGKMIFLYEEDAEDIRYARENAHRPVIMLYNDATPYHVWWRSQELMEYDRIYFVSQGNKELITDEAICGSDKVIVYAADYDTQQECLDMILKSNPGLAGYRLISQKSLWSVYEFE